MADYFLTGGVRASDRLRQIRDTQRQRQESVAGVNATLPPNQAPYSGYMGEKDYIQGLNEAGEAADIQNRLRGGPGARVVGGGTMRPSIDALRNSSFEDFARRTGSYRPGNPEDIERRQGQSADLEAEHQAMPEMQRQRRVIAEGEARTDRGIEEDRARNAEAFDINTGRVKTRGEAIGEAEGARGRAVRRAQTEQYFDPAEAKRRQDELYYRMEELRRRYADPALIAAQARMDAERIKALGGVERANVTGQAARDVQASRGNALRDIGRMGQQGRTGAAAIAAGAPASQYAEPTYAPPEILDQLKGQAPGDFEDPDSGAVWRLNPDGSIHRIR